MFKINSNLDKYIIYERKNILERNDNGTVAQVYKVEILGKIYYIALGKPNRSYSDHNLIFFPIYLIVNDKVASQLGVYEIPLETFNQNSESLLYIYDSDNDLNIPKLGTPILYSDIEHILNQVDAGIYLKKTKIKPKSKLKSKEKTKTKKLVIIPTLLDDTGESTGSSTKSLPKSKTRKSRSIHDNWIQKYLENKDNSYRIQDNEGGGDCLFAVIRDAYRSSNLDPSLIESRSVENLRKLVVSNITADQFLDYKKLYNDIKAEQTKLQQELLGEEQKIRVSSETYDAGEKISELNEQILINQNLLLDFQDVENINSLEEYREKFLECKFWANGAAINQLEKILNIKFVIFSYQNYIENRYENVIQCGETAEYDKSKGPIYYILADYTDNTHYKLIKYKEKGLFTFNELPDIVIKKIEQQCLQRKSGAYYVIPEFQALADQ